MRSRKHPRGGAAVETAILMIVLVPTILYTLFLEDLLNFKLEQEETVVSTPWDFASHDYREKSTGDITGTVVRASMQTYWDHTSAHNSYTDPNFDAKNTVHHQALTAHQCWLAKGGKEVECGVSSTVGVTQIDGTFIMMNRGGLASCTAVLGVQNYFIPMSLFGGKFSGGNGGGGGKKATGGGNEVSMTGGKLREEKFNEKSGDSAIHGNAKQDPYVFPEGRFGVVHDPWALNRMENVYNPLVHPANRVGRFTRWMNIPYGRARSYLDDATKFADDAIDKEFLTSQVKEDGVGDDLTTPPVAWKGDPARKYGSHWASGYSDDRHENTQGKLKDAYMGVEETKW